MEIKKSSRKTAFSSPEGLKFLGRLLSGKAKKEVEATKRLAARLKRQADSKAQPPPQVIDQQDRWGNAGALDEKQRIDKEALLQKLEMQSAPEQRKDTTGDIFGGPTAEDAMQAKRAAEASRAKAPTGPSLFDEDLAASEIIPLTIHTAGNAGELSQSHQATVNSGIDLEIVQHGFVLAVYHIERGARTFAAYAKAMISDIGEEYKPYLKSWYLAVKYHPRFSAFDGFDSAATVEAASLETTGQDPTSFSDGPKEDSVGATNLPERSPTELEYRYPLPPERVLAKSPLEPGYVGTYSPPPEYKIPNRQGQATQPAILPILSRAESAQIALQTTPGLAMAMLRAHAEENSDSERIPELTNEQMQTTLLNRSRQIQRR